MEMLGVKPGSPTSGASTGSTVDCKLLAAGSAGTVDAPTGGSVAFRLLPVSVATQKAILNTPNTPIAAIATAPKAARPQHGREDTRSQRFQGKQCQEAA